MQPPIDMVNEGQYAGDERLFVRFYMNSVQNVNRSKEVGHPVFDDVAFVKIMVPGDKHTVVDTKATDEHKHRFARLWAAFESKQEQITEGWPITEWAAITRAQADELAYLNIRTVEQLAGMADSLGQKIMGFQTLKAKAVAALATAKDNAASQALAEMNEKLQIQIKALQDEIARMSARYEQEVGGGKNAAGGSAGRSR